MLIRRLPGRGFHDLVKEEDGGLRDHVGEEQHGICQRGRRRVHLRENMDLVSQDSTQPLVPVPEILRRVASVHALDHGLLLVSEAEPADGGQDDAFCERRQRLLGAGAGDPFRQQVHQDRLAALELELWSW